MEKQTAIAANLIVISGIVIALSLIGIPVVLSILMAVTVVYVAAWLAGEV